jgi:hypothetical protein
MGADVLVCVVADWFISENQNKEGVNKRNWQGRRWVPLLQTLIIIVVG